MWREEEGYRNRQAYLLTVLYHRPGASTVCWVRILGECLRVKGAAKTDGRKEGRAIGPGPSGRSFRSSSPAHKSHKTVISPQCAEKIMKDPSKVDGAGGEVRVLVPKKKEGPQRSRRRHPTTKERGREGGREREKT